LISTRNLLLLSFLLSLGCRSVSHLELEPSKHPTTPIDLDYIERCALLDQWANIREHLVQVDGEALPRSQKPLALFWMGMAQHHLGRAAAAETSWDRAMGFHPSNSLQRRIQRAQQALRSYGSNRPAGRDSKIWALQYGVFSLRKSAEDLARELSWKGLNLQISKSNGTRGQLWTVWSGPYSGPQARLKQESLQNRNVASIVKPSREFNL
jgi:hypothetical protein